MNAKKTGHSQRVMRDYYARCSVFSSPVKQIKT